MKRIVFRLGLAAALGALSPAATAQLAPFAHEVFLLAPQLQAFAGSRANFESLASGLREGAEVTLTRIGADGALDVVRFTPAVPLSAADTARVLESARQRLITLGIDAPGPEAIGVALMGGTLAAPGGAVKLPGLLPPADAKKPLAIAHTTLAGSVENYRNLVRGLGEGSAVRLDTPGKASVSFTAPGGPLPAEAVGEALQMAADLLAAHGIRNPTPAELRAALVGGSVTSASGASVALRGVLQGRARATSASPGTGHTSDSPGTGHTSDRPGSAFTSDTPPAKPPAVRPAEKAPLRKAP